MPCIHNGSHQFFSIFYCKLLKDLRFQRTYLKLDRQETFLMSLHIHFLCKLARNGKDFASNHEKSKARFFKYMNMIFNGMQKK